LEIEGEYRGKQRAGNGPTTSDQIGEHAEEDGEEQNRRQAGKKK
jgi:hypothetical protein